MEDASYIFSTPRPAAGRRIYIRLWLDDSLWARDAFYLCGCGDVRLSNFLTESSAAPLWLAFSATLRRRSSVFAAGFRAAVTECPHSDSDCYTRRGDGL